MTSDPASGGLAAARADCWRQLEAGAASRKHGFHLPSLATIGFDGTPEVRLLVLRAVDPANRTLRLHSDARSPKVEQIAARPDVALVAYDAEAKVQLRLTGRAAVGDPALGEAAWLSSSRFARRCYLAEAAPSSPAPGPMSGLPAGVEGREPDEDELAPAFANFAIILVTIDRMDWLHLANTGHRRAQFAWDEETARWSGEWRIP